MSKTPRTDDAMTWSSDMGRLVVNAEIAQKIESELAEARAEIERLKCCTNCGSRLWAATGKGNCKNCKDFSAWTSQNKAALAAERLEE